MLGLKKNNLITTKEAYKILMRKYPAEWIYYAEIDDEAWFGTENIFEWVVVDKRTKKIEEGEYPARTICDGMFGEPKYDDNYKKRLMNAVSNPQKIDWK